MPIFDNNAQSIGRTPLLRLKQISQGLNATILPKVKSRNSAYSVGISLTLTMPETMSLERRKLLIAFGAKLILTEGAF